MNFKSIEDYDNYYEHICNYFLSDSIKDHCSTKYSYEMAFKMNMDSIISKKDFKNSIGVKLEKIAKAIKVLSFNDEKLNVFVDKLINKYNADNNPSVNYTYVIFYAMKKCIQNRVIPTVKHYFKLCDNIELKNGILNMMDKRFNTFDNIMENYESVYKLCAVLNKKCNQ